MVLDECSSMARRASVSFCMMEISFVWSMAGILKYRAAVRFRTPAWFQMDRETHDKCGTVLLFLHFKVSSAFLLSPAKDVQAAEDIVILKTLKQLQKHSEQQKIILSLKRFGKQECSKYGYFYLSSYIGQQ